MTTLTELERAYRSELFARVNKCVVYDLEAQRNARWKTHFPRGGVYNRLSTIALRKAINGAIPDDRWSLDRMNYYFKLVRSEAEE